MFQDTSTLRVGDQKWKAPAVDLVAVGLGVILWLFWLRAAIAGYAAWYFCQRSVPIRRPSLAGHDIEETTKDALSSNDEYALINKDLDEDDGDSRFSSHHGRSGSVASYDAHPGNPIPWGGKGSAYDGIGGHGPVAWMRIEEPCPSLRLRITITGGATVN